MKILSIDINSPCLTSRLSVDIDGDLLLLVLTTEEKERFLQIGAEIFTARQKAIAHKIETAGPILLTAEEPAPVRPEYDLDDDVPF